MTSIHGYWVSGSWTQHASHMIVMLGLLASWLGFEQPLPGWVRAKSGDACLFVASMDDLLCPPPMGFGTNP